MYKKWSCIQIFVNKDYDSFWNSKYHHQNNSNVKFLEKGYNPFNNNELIEDLFNQMFEFDPMKRIKARKDNPFNNNEIQFRKYRKSANCVNCILFIIWISQLSLQRPYWPHIVLLKLILSNGHGKVLFWLYELCIPIKFQQ